MSVVYRIKTTLFEFDAVGRIERAAGVCLLRLSVTIDQAFAVQHDINAKKRVELLACDGDQVVMPGWTSKVKARPDGARVDLACLLA